MYEIVTDKCKKNLQVYIVQMHVIGQIKHKIITIYNLQL